MKNNTKHQGKSWKNQKHQNWINQNWKKKVWNTKFFTWMIAFLVSFLLTACGSTEEGILNSAGVVNGVTESLEISDSSAVINSGTDTAQTEDDGKESQEDIPEDELAEDGAYTSKEDVAYYLYLYGHLPSNFITKKEAENLGWKGGSLEPFAPGMCIGGNRFGNYEGLLPAKEGRFYTECDIDTLGADKRGAKRIVFSNDGLIYYTEDHYQTFELLYGEE